MLCFPIFYKTVIGLELNAKTVQDESQFPDTKRQNVYCVDDNWYSTRHNIAPRESWIQFIYRVTVWVIANLIWFLQE